MERRVKAIKKNPSIEEVVDSMTWCLDTRSSNHMNGNKNLLYDFD